MADEEAGRSHFVLLNRCFKIDPFIDEIDIIPSPIKCQKEEPVILQDHKLGMKMWCVRELYNYAYKIFLQKKTTLVTDDILDMTRAVLILNAECYIAWNTRKECSLCGKLRIEEDLKFCDLILTLHPRSVETFIHRRWLLRQYHKHNRSIDDLEMLLKHELLICTITAGKHEANYMSWSHREWVIDTFLVRNLKELMSDWKKTKQWIQSNISDHSGFQYRQFLLKTLQPLCNVEHLVSSELNLTGNLIKAFPGHEAVWNHRRYLVHYYYNLLRLRPFHNTTNKSEPDDSVLSEPCKKECHPRSESDGQTPSSKNILPITKKRKFKEGTVKIRNEWSIEEELLFIDEVVQGTGNITSQRLYSERHRKWIKFIIN